MKWVLIFILVNYYAEGGNVSGTAEFGTKSECEAAIAAIEPQSKRVSGIESKKNLIICLPSTTSTQNTRNK